MNYKTVIFYLFLFLFSSTSLATNGMKTGNKLLPECRAAVKVMENLELTSLTMTDVIDGTACTESVRAIQDLNSMYQARLQMLLEREKSDTGIFCIDQEGISNLQVIKIIVKHLEQNPETLHYPSNFLIGTILAEKFPCKNSIWRNDAQLK